jgi:hypothetical protein
MSRHGRAAAVDSPVATSVERESWVGRALPRLEDKGVWLAVLLMTPPVPGGWLTGTFRI